MQFGPPLARLATSALLALPLAALLQGCQPAEDEAMRRQAACHSAEMDDALFKYTYAAVSMAKQGQLTREKQGWYLDHRTRRLPEHIRDDWARATAATLAQLQLFRGDGSWDDTLKVVAHTKQLYLGA
ncbi:hypothetical protein [Caldimonas thermodepolymerans]|jgi:hypothetical protein|uniref:DUF1311 domain-containing protein n=2 Tax=Caldimonas thermodepolymerans TaxID=215580 RepID=A0AA46DHK3_9BURK|nr:hypothetical protein [Caldimonas thermodepolymerans]RDI03784.1 hypothetical protein DES46_101472 [Caldimonas thermodepolymerans]TCP09751.1 hypothetical protein EV676_101330 [Caldimonas thermodepolymerans]